MKHLYTRGGQLNKDLLKNPVVIWGIGNDGMRLYKEITERGGSVRYFCDSKARNEVLDSSFGVQIISPDVAINIKECVLALAFHQWPDVLSFVNKNFKGSVYADYRYEDPTNDKCIICGSKCTSSRAHFAPFLVERAFCGDLKKTCAIKCIKCGFTFSSYRPTDIELGRLYHHYRGIDYLQQRKKFEDRYTYEENYQYLSEEYILNRKTALSKFLSDAINFMEIETVLDYGGDRGQFIPEELSHGKRYVYEVSSVEVCEGVSLLSKLEDVRNRTWDLVLCAHLLEHVADPYEIIDNLVAGIRKGGYLYIEVPYETQYERYHDYEFHEHINFYNINSMEKIAERYDNFSIVKLEYKDKIHNTICLLLKRTG